MNGSEVLRIVDAIHRDKNIDKEIVFEGIAQAILSAARKHFGEEHELEVEINRTTGEPTVRCDGKELEPDVLGDILGRIAAQTAKQVMIQKIREAERDAIFEEFSALKGQIVTGSVSRVEGNTVVVNLGKTEGLLPRGEQIPGESFRVGDRVRAIVLEVRKSGSRVKIILSRTHPDLVRRLFELEIPEVAERIIEVRSLAREAGYRSKVAVSCIDSKIDAVGACVGVRGSRIKSVVDELAGERIDIVKWNDSLQVLVPNALQPAEVEDVILCPMLGRVIVLVREDQLSLAIGKRGQNVRLASKLVGWDIEVMTREELDEQLDRSVEAFSSIEGVSEELAEALVAQGFFSYYDLACIEPDQLAELGGLTPEQCDAIIAYADQAAMKQEEEEERLRAEARARQAQERAEAELAAQQAESAEAAESGEAAESAVSGEATSEQTSEAAESVQASADTESAESETPQTEAASAGESSAVAEAAEPGDTGAQPTSEQSENVSAEAGAAEASTPQDTAAGTTEEDAQTAVSAESTAEAAESEASPAVPRMSKAEATED